MPRNKKRLFSGTGAGIPFIEKSRYLVFISSSTEMDWHFMPVSEDRQSCASS
jgi:hypothetical protein